MKKRHVKALILPKFEVGRMSGDFPGEAQFYYEAYLEGGEAYTVRGCAGDLTVYYKDGVALCVIGQGKVSAAVNTGAVLADDRFDFSGAFVISTGCAGVAAGYGVMGDVFVVSAAVDYDLGHHADPRELHAAAETTWFHDENYDKNAVVRLAPALVDRVYSMVKNLSLETTDKTRAYMKAAFPGEAWADRQPKVLRGAAVSGDNFWKGAYGHKNALLITRTYGCPDPYAVTEMEDVAIGQTLRCFDLQDRYIVLRGGVNMDVFTLGLSPEALWSTSSADKLATDDGAETADIFQTAMKNTFAVGRVVIDAILKNELLPQTE